MFQYLPLKQSRPGSRHLSIRAAEFGESFASPAHKFIPLLARAVAIEMAVVAHDAANILNPCRAASLASAAAGSPGGTPQRLRPILISTTTSNWVLRFRCTIAISVITDSLSTAMTTEERRESSASRLSLASSRNLIRDQNALDSMLN